MLIISNKQIEELGKISRASFVKRAKEFIKEKYPKNISDIPSEFEKQLEEGIQIAEGHNIVEAEDVLSFLEYHFVLGKNFELNDEFSWAKKILYVRNLSGTEKMDRLKNKLLLP